MGPAAGSAGGRQVASIDTLLEPAGQDEDGRTAIPMADAQVRESKKKKSQKSSFTLARSGLLRRHRHSSSPDALAN